MSLTLLQNNVVENAPKNDPKFKHIKGVDYIVHKVEDILKPESKAPRVLVLKSGTGSGKSTLLPPALYNRFKTKLLLTQLTKVNTKTIFEQIVQYNSSLRPGQNIGYQTGDVSDRPASGILICTLGVLLMMFKKNTMENLLKQYPIILVDEVHDKKIDIDMVLYYAYKADRNVKQSQRFCFVFMSGTLDLELLQNYFSLPESNIIMIKERDSFPIEIKWPKTDIENIYSYILNTVSGIVSSVTVGTKVKILVFLSGEAMIEGLISLFESYNKTCRNEKDLINGIKLTSATSKTVDVNSDKIYDIVIENKHIIASNAVFLATNVIETGITIHDLDYCIDSGYELNVSYSPKIDGYVLINKNISQSSMQQRKGRVGRVRPGTFIPCYTESVFKSFEKKNKSDIETKDICLFLLDMIIDYTKSELIKENIKENNSYSVMYSNDFRMDVNLIQKPPIDNVMFGMNKLYRYGFIDSYCRVTVDGMIASYISKLLPESVKMLISGLKYGVNMIDMITLVAIYELKVIYRPDLPAIDTRDLCLNQKELSMFIADDMIEILLLYKQFQNKIDHYIDNVFKIGKKESKLLTIMLDITKKRDEIMNMLIDAGIDPYTRQGLETVSSPIDLLSLLKSREDLPAFYVEVCKIKRCFREALVVAKLIDGRYYLINDFYNDILPVRLDRTSVGRFEFPKEIIIHGVRMNMSKQFDSVVIGDRVNISVMDDF